MCQPPRRHHHPAGRFELCPVTIDPVGDQNRLAFARRHDSDVCLRATVGSLPPLDEWLTCGDRRRARLAHSPPRRQIEDVSPLQWCDTLSRWLRYRCAELGGGERAADAGLWQREDTCDEIAYQSV